MTATLTDPSTAPAVADELGDDICSHGQAPGDDGPCIEVGGRRGDLVDEHRRACRRPRVFWHPHLLRRTICCASCQAVLR